MTWNALADSLADSFPDVDKKYLTWEYRKGLIMQVIEENSYDIVCLQEVEHFNDFYQPEMEKLGYEGIFQSKFSEDNVERDGVALMWKKSKFEKKNHDIIRYTPNDTQLAIISLLYGKSGKNVPSVCVATTHLKASIGFEDKRKTQGVSLLESVDKVNTEKYPVVICGDFNDTPDSLVCNKFRKHFSSAYSGESWTTWKKRETVVKRTIDYIWYDYDSFRVTETLETPNKSEIDPPYLPSAHYPSDHICIACKLETKESLRVSSATRKL